MSVTIPLDARGCLDWAQRGEQLGYESVWIAEAADPEPFVLAGAIAQLTERVRIGLAVSPVYTRTPATIAAAAGTVSQLAPGRFILGLGSSSHAIVENWHGIPFRRPLARVRETVTTVRGMLEGKKLTFDGKMVRSSGFRLTVPPPAPLPIYVGALRPAMLELAGEIADGVVVNLFPVAALPKMLDHVAVGARRAGKNLQQLEIVCRQQVLVTDDKAAAREIFRTAFAGYFATPVYNRYAAWYGFDEEAALIAKGFDDGDRTLTRKGMSDRLIDAIGIYGSPEECCERIAAYVAAGVTTTAINVFSFHHSDLRRTLEALAPGLS